MKIGGCEIITPDEDAIGYDLDWRWRMANALVGLAAGGAVMPLIQDPDVRALVRHLTRKSKPDVAVKLDAIGRVICWRGTQTGALVEAFLIAASNCEEAAKEMGIAVQELRLYSCLFFDLRDDEGSIRPAVLMRMSADIQATDEPDTAARLRKVALTGGVHGLRRLLNSEQQHRAAEEPTLDAMVEAELKRRLAAGELRTGDLVRMQSNAITRERMKREEDGGRNGDRLESLEVLRSILSLTTPYMVKPDCDPESVDAANQEIRARFAAQKNIGATPLTDDPEKGEAALTKMMGDTFKQRAGDV